jgi:quercetin dioxygenase-like cupin family protein
MGFVDFDDAEPDNQVAGYSQGRGAVLRSDHFEVIRIHFEKGHGADPHSHEHDQFTYILSGRMRVTLGDGEEVYEIGPGQATFNPTGVVHSVEALEDTTALSIKAPLLEEQEYEATGTLS